MVVRASLIVFILMISVQSKTQPLNYEHIDNYIKNLPSSETQTLPQLSKSLVKTSLNDFEKVRAIYVWISKNVVYDFKSFLSGNVPDQSAQSAFQSKKAVCQGYSELFAELCKRNNIEGYVITGYSKGFGYKPNKKFKSTDHAWNAVKLDNKWFLIDVTWGSGYVNEKNQYIVQFNEDHFLASPNVFILKHLPSDPIWQLIPEPISVQTYEKDSNFIKSAIKKEISGINYLDSLKNYSMLDSVGKIINANKRMIRYNPENGEAYYKLGWYYFQKAWENMNKLNDPKIQRNKALAKPLAEQAIYYQKEALRYLKETEKRDSFYSEDIKQKREIIANNMISLEQIAK